MFSRHNLIQLLPLKSFKSDFQRKLQKWKKQSLASSFKPNVTKLYFECNFRQISHWQNLSKNKINSSPSSSRNQLIYSNSGKHFWNLPATEDSPTQTTRKKGRNRNNKKEQNLNIWSSTVLNTCICHLSLKSDSWFNSSEWDLFHRFLFKEDLSHLTAHVSFNKFVWKLNVQRFRTVWFCPSLKTKLSSHWWK